MMDSKLHEDIVSFADLYYRVKHLEKRYSQEEKKIQPLEFGYILHLVSRVTNYNSSRAKELINEFAKDRKSFIEQKLPELEKKDKARPLYRSDELDQIFNAAREYFADVCKVVKKKMKDNLSGIEVYRKKASPDMVQLLHNELGELEQTCQDILSKIE